MPSNRKPERRFRSALLGWTDEESGDELTVRVRGSDRFLRDLPVIQAITLLLAMVYALSNLLSDLVIAALDPRVRYE